MTYSHRAAAAALMGLTALGCAGPASADPVDPFVVPAPPAPVITYPVAPAANGAAMTPHQLAVPGAAPPPASSVSDGGIPEIQNPVYGSGKYGGGILGTLKDLWDQARNPAFVPDQIMGGAPVPGAPTSGGPTGTGGGSAPGPALPPGYYPIDGPPPPGYQYTTP